MKELSEEEDKPVKTNRYPVFDWIPGTKIDDKDDAQDEADTDEGDDQGAPYTEGQADQDMNETEHEHEIDDKDRNSDSDDDKNRDKENDTYYDTYTEHENKFNLNENKQGASNKDISTRRNN